ncbi:MAG: uroporphyrinogen-III synthase [Bauldia sp.]|nr:uroporphyrinogen-III synthase [Bauldia sp.]
MRLLLTRSEPEAAETAATLRARGHEVIVEPMLEIVFEPAPEGLAPAGLVVSSKNGVRALASWPDARKWHDLPLFAVGDETAEAARAEGFRNVQSASGTSEELAALVKRAFPPANGLLLYVAAADRTPTLEMRLSEAGYDLATAIAYRAMPPAALRPETVAALEEGAVEGIVLFSRRAAEALRALLPRAGLRLAVREMDVFALSEKTAGGFAGVAARSIKVAPHADAESLLGLIP